jgi:hypothetical protein
MSPLKRGILISGAALAMALSPLQPIGTEQLAKAAENDQTLLGKLCHQVSALVSPQKAKAADCPYTLGTSTNETGSYRGETFNFNDAYTFDSGVPFQYQRASVLSTQSLACEHYRGNQVIKGEDWLILNHISWNPDNMTPAPTEPGTYTIGADQIGTDGITHHTQAVSIAVRKQCSPQQKDASSGTVTYTQIDTTGATGHYDVWFGSDHLTGDFYAPFCNLCQQRPTNQTCLNS